MSIREPSPRAHALPVDRATNGTDGTDGRIVLPSREDPLVRLLSEAVGGPLGPRVRLGAARFWTPMTVVLLLGVVTVLAGLAAKQHCRSEGWSTPDQYFHVCYSDLPALYGSRGLADGVMPYLGRVGVEQVEYPVLTGALMWIEAKAVRGEGYTTQTALTFFDINLLLAAAFLFGTIAATLRTAGRRPWDAAIVALSPAIAFTMTINWDMLAVLLTALALLHWSRDRPVAAGVMLGLAAAAKFYPLLLLGPLLILCVRAGRLREWFMLLGAAVAAWSAVNLPVALVAYDGWWHFYAQSRDRGLSWGSFWVVLSHHGPFLSVGLLNTLATALLIACCLAIAWLALAAPRRPRVAQLAFLVVAAFLLTNKVYSPQFVLWLVPLAALARPRWRDMLIWQLCEVVHFVGTWLYLAGYTESAASRSLPENGYDATVLIHIGGTLWLAAVIVRDIWLPAYDPVRSGDLAEDDPGGGPLAGAPDVVVLRGLRLGGATAR